MTKLDCKLVRVPGKKTFGEVLMLFPGSTQNVRVKELQYFRRNIVTD